MKNLLLCLSPIWVTLGIGLLSPSSPAPAEQTPSRVSTLEWEMEGLLTQHQAMIRAQLRMEARIHQLEIEAQPKRERATLGVPCHDCGEPLESCECPLQAQREPNPRCRCSAESW